MPKRMTGIFQIGIYCLPSLAIRFLPALPRALLVVAAQDELFFAEHVADLVQFIDTRILAEIRGFLDALRGPRELGFLARRGPGGRVPGCFPVQCLVEVLEERGEDFFRLHAGLVTR
jgi:hypothetical protein